MEGQTKRQLYSSPSQSIKIIDWDVKKMEGQTWPLLYSTPWESIKIDDWEVKHQQTKIRSLLFPQNICLQGEIKILIHILTSNRHRHNESKWTTFSLITSMLLASQGASQIYRENSSRFFTWGFCRIFFFTNPYAVCTHLNCLNEAIQMSTHSICLRYNLDIFVVIMNYIGWVGALEVCYWN